MPQSKETPESLKTTQHGGRHYKDMAIQPAEYCHKNELPFCAAEAIKYLSRYRSKNGAEDIKKAIHFAQMILDMDYRIQTTVIFSDDPRQNPPECQIPQQLVERPLAKPKRTKPLLAAASGILRKGKAKPAKPTKHPDSLRGVRSS